MLILTLLACDWGKPTPTPSAPAPAAAEVAPAAPLPAAPRRGVGEVPTPAEVVRASLVQEVEAPGFVDVWFDAERLDFAQLGTRLEGWGLTRTDGDGRSWRVAAPEGGARLLDRLLLADGVADARVSLARGTLPSGAVREGSERYGELAHTWSIGPDGPRQSVTGGSPVPPPVLPAALPAGARACLGSVQEDLADGVSAGVGWERALSTRLGGGPGGPGAVPRTRLAPPAEGRPHLDVHGG
jgi:hypothetical protein